MDLIIVNLIKFWLSLNLINVADSKSKTSNIVIVGYLYLNCSKLVGMDK